MRSSGYTEVRWGRSVVSIWSTHPEFVEPLVERVKKLFTPKNVDTVTLVGDTPFHWELSELGEGHRVAFWLVKELCGLGWVPFETGSGVNIFKLRLESD